MNHVKVYCSPSPADMRWGFDRLAEVCRSGLTKDPYSGELFLFFNRSRDLARIIYFDGSGSCTFTKRLEKGRFKVPTLDTGKGAMDIQASELTLLLEGVKIGSFKRPSPWKPTQLGLPSNDEKSY